MTTAQYHTFDAATVSYHMYRHGGVAYSSYIFTPNKEDSNV